MTNLEPPIREMTTLRKREGGMEGGREEGKGRREGGRGRGRERERVTITVHVFVCYKVCENTFIKNRQDLKTYMYVIPLYLSFLFIPPERFRD